MAGKVDRLVADALHQAAVAGDDVGVVVDEVVAEAGIQHALGERHADGVGEPLPERPGGGLDRPAHGRTSGWPAVRDAELAEALSSSSVMSG